MGSVKDRIKSLKPYFQEMQVTSDDEGEVIYVIVRFPDNWVIDNEIEKNYPVTIAQGNERNQYYFLTEISNGFDSVFDAIECNINKMLSAQERAALLKAKVIELKNIFEDEEISLDSLRTLDFTYKGKKKKAALLESENKKEEAIVYEVAEEVVEKVPEVKNVEKPMGNTVIDSIKKITKKKK